MEGGAGVGTASPARKKEEDERGAPVKSKKGFSGRSFYKQVTPSGVRGPFPANPGWRKAAESLNEDRY